MPQSATLGKDSSPNPKPHQFIVPNRRNAREHESGRQRKECFLSALICNVHCCGNAPAASSLSRAKRDTPFLVMKKSSLLTSPPRYPHLLNGFSCHSGIHSNGSDRKSLLRSDLFPPLYQLPYPKARNEVVATLLKNTACLKMLLLDGKEEV